MLCLEHFEQESNIEKITVFPDIHYCSEKAIPVGVSFKTKDVFYPLITGKDMGCGVAYLKIDKKDTNLSSEKEERFIIFIYSI